MSQENTSMQAVAETVMNYKREAEQAKQTRMQQNRKNFDMYHMRQDFSHKLKGQSQEFLPRQAMAVEQIAQFLHQGLMDFGDYFSINKLPGVKNPLFSENQARDLLKAQLEKADFYNYVLDSLKSGLLGALMVGKVHGCYVQSPKFRAEKKGNDSKLLRLKDKHWQLKFSLVRQKNFFPDPTGEGLYNVEEIEFDLWKLEQLVMNNKERYDVEQFNALKSSLEASDKADELDKARETNQNVAPNSFRKRVLLHECWGNILDPHTGKLLYEKKVCLVANDKFVIMKPQPFPNWLGDDPYVVAPLLRSPNSVWHKALMDAPTWLNQALNEIFNLIVDGGLQSIFGIKQIREHWLEDPSQISEGVGPGTTLSVNQACPPGQKVIERVDTGNTSSEGVNAFNLASGEFNQSALQNDLRVGTLPPRAVKATEVVEASQSITSVFTGIGKSVETQFVEKLFDKAWNQILQNFEKMNAEELKALLGDNAYESISKLSPEERYAQSAGGLKFKVFGITQTMNKIKDFRKLTTMLQTIASNPTLGEAFTQKYDFTKMLGEIIKALDVNEDRIKLDSVDQQMNQLPAADAPVQPGMLPQGPDMQSQTPQAGADGAFEAEPGQMSGDAFQ